MNHKRIGTYREFRGNATPVEKAALALWQQGVKLLSLKQELNIIWACPKCLSFRERVTHTQF